MAHETLLKANPLVAHIRSKLAEISIKGIAIKLVDTTKGVFYIHKDNHTFHTDLDTSPNSEVKNSMLIREIIRQIAIYLSRVEQSLISDTQSFVNLKEKYGVK